MPYGFDPRQRHQKSRMRQRSGFYFFTFHSSLFTAFYRLAGILLYGPGTGLGRRHLHTRLYSELHLKN